MITYALLELGEDGQVSAFFVGACATCKPVHPVVNNSNMRNASPVASGTDRGQFKTFEIGRYSIDVMELPELKERK